MAYQENTKPYVPLTCHGHSRPVPHINFSGFVGGEDEFYMISACKDNNPMLRDGLTGDWIGTFFGHKGAVFQARLSPDASTAATASADYTAKIWDTHSGETIYTLEHPSVVRCVAFPPDHGSLVATGGVDKVFRIHDLSRAPTANGNTKSDATNGITIPSSTAIEIGAGVHKGIIKSIVWTNNPNVLVTAADDKMIRWWDLRTNSVIQELPVSGEVGSCEFTNIKPRPGNIGDGYPVLCIAAGKTVYFYGGSDARTLIKSVNLPYETASVALHPGQRKFVVGGKQDTWVKVYNYDTEQELDVHKGHHGPIWSISFSPDGKLYATGSEDGTIKMWKNCAGAYGLWRSND